MCSIKIAQPLRSGYLESLGPQEHGMLESVLSCSAIGGPDAVRCGLEAFIARTGDDELMVTSQIYDHAARLRSYEITAAVRDGAA